MCFAWRLWPMGFQTEFVRENLSQNYLRTQKPTRPERNLLCNYQKCALPGQTWYLLQGFKVLPYWHLNWVIQEWYCDRLSQNIKVENSKKKYGCRIAFGFFFCLIFFWFSFPVPFALYLQQFGTRTCRFAWYLLHFGMVTLHFAWFATFGHVCLPFCMVFVIFGISTSHLHGIYYILVLQTFMWVSWKFFRLSFRVSFKVSFRVSFKVLFRVSFRVSLGFHLGFHLGFL